MATFQYKVGLGNVGSYQVSGKPFASGNIDAQVGSGGTHGDGSVAIHFPQITRWVQVNNSGSADLRVGFSAFGLTGTNYLLVKADTELGPLELKLTELHLTGGVSGGTSVIAGCTFIATESINNLSVSPNGSNWSGSAGVG